MNDHGREIKRCLCYIPQKDSTATSRNQQTEQRATNNDRHNYQLARVVVNNKIRRKAPTRTHGVLCIGIFLAFGGSIFIARTS